MIGAGGVDAMFITDHLPELPGKSKESSTSQGPDNYAPLLLCELQIRLWRALPKDLAFLLPACLPHPSPSHMHLRKNGSFHCLGREMLCGLKGPAIAGTGLGRWRQSPWAQRDGGGGQRKRVTAAGAHPALHVTAAHARARRPTKGGAAHVLVALRGDCAAVDG